MPGQNAPNPSWDMPPPGADPAFPGNTVPGYPYGPPPIPGMPPSQGGTPPDLSGQQNWPTIFPGGGIPPSQASGGNRESGQFVDTPTFDPRQVGGYPGGPVPSSQQAVSTGGSREAGGAGASPGDGTKPRLVVDPNDPTKLIPDPLDPNTYAPTAVQGENAQGLMARYLDTGHHDYLYTALQEAMRGAGVYSGNPFERHIQEDLAATLVDYQTLNRARQDAGLDPHKFGDVLGERMQTGSLAPGVNPAYLQALMNPSGSGLSDKQIGLLESHAGDIEANPQMAFA